METKTETITIEELSKESGVSIYKCNASKMAKDAGLVNPEKYSKEKKKVVMEEVEGVSGAFLLHDVLSESECKSFVEITEKMSYVEALVSTFGGMVKMEDLRNNQRVIWQMEQQDELLTLLWERIAPHMPKGELRGSRWTPVSLNERFRFYKYDKEEQFGQHYDGCFPRSSSEMSFLTFIVYLNDDFEGGATTFYVGRNKCKVQPKRGSALLFWHGPHPKSPLHEGSIVEKGTKYVLRSDIMYNKDNKK